MCLQCCTNAVDYGEVLPGWGLYRAQKDDQEIDPVWPKDHWGLIQCNDPDFVWEVTPELDPSFGKTDDQINAETPEEWEASEAWLKKVAEFSNDLISDPKTGYQLVAAAVEAGYDLETDGRFEAWFFHRMARIIRARIME